MDADETTDERIVAPDHWLHDEYTTKLRKEANRRLVDCSDILRSACRLSLDPDVRECIANLRNAEEVVSMLSGVER